MFFDVTVFDLNRICCAARMDASGNSATATFWIYGREVRTTRRSICSSSMAHWAETAATIHRRFFLDAARRRRGSR